MSVSGTLVSSPTVPATWLRASLPGGPARDQRSGRHRDQIPMRATAAPAVMAALTLALVGAACAGTPAGGTSPRNRNLISLEEIEQAREDGVRDLYELIDRIRPRWLLGRNARSLQLQTVIAVYHHEALLGGIDALRGYPLVSVTSIRWLDAAQAMLLPGAGSTHVEGAIVISTEIVPNSGAGPVSRRLLPGGV